jgi:hypothetical protein
MRLVFKACQVRGILINAQLLIGGPEGPHLWSKEKLKEASPEIKLTSDGIKVVSLHSLCLLRGHATLLGR